ncbi:hypothetical protein FACS1894162_4450 [Bacteroidia bacterium]|nr:hypothetical protein FACS1894162_4450 [Bacteroidia bacterium]
MKKYILLLAFVFALIVPSVATEPVLKDTQGWEIDSIAPGMTWYKYYKKYKSVNQRINVLEIDVQRPEYSLEIKYIPSADSLSHLAYMSGAIAGINGAYELYASFIRSNGTTYSQPSRAVQETTHLRHWKYEGAFFYNDETKSVDIQYRENDGDGYYSSLYPNIISGAPVLIRNYTPVGASFVGDVSGLNLDALDYEDYRRHQGVRHPRTAIAIMEDGKALLITVDGRRTVSEGINAKDLTEFITYYFNPKHALNLDGGGSTAMYIQGEAGYDNNGIINCPVDENMDYNQRLLNSFILVKKKNISSQQEINRDNHLVVKHQPNGLLISSDKNIQTITLYNITGQKLYENILPGKQYEIRDIPTGVYILKALVENRSISQKIIIK